MGHAATEALKIALGERRGTRWAYFLATFFTCAFVAFLHSLGPASSEHPLVLLFLLTAGVVAAWQDQLRTTLALLPGL